MVESNYVVVGAFDGGLAEFKAGGVQGEQVLESINFGERVQEYSAMRFLIHSVHCDFNWRNAMSIGALRSCAFS